ncbi:hypothetical protein PS925_05460 [Pseudomonas fluorescens]|uniref:Uncharacterized protein n=1 Tax=Pseudomonas fluorescens TaxID=294 RepID=A0A5E7VN91_PSEFL|nr:hypothetical protein PS925_05460 [Pseudomonas fluorescens]
MTDTGNPQLHDLRITGRVSDGDVLPIGGDFGHAALTRITVIGLNGRAGLKGNSGNQAEQPERLTSPGRLPAKSLGLCLILELILLRIGKVRLEGRVNVVHFGRCRDAEQRQQTNPSPDARGAKKTQGRSPKIYQYQRYTRRFIRPALGH